MATQHTTAHRGFYFYTVRIHKREERSCHSFAKCRTSSRAKESGERWDPVDKVRPRVYKKITGLPVGCLRFASDFIPAPFPSPRSSHFNRWLSRHVQRRVLSMLYLVDRYMDIFYDCADSLIKSLIKLNICFNATYIVFTILPYLEESFSKRLLVPLKKVKVT